MMDWVKKRWKYIILGAGCGAVAYFTYLKVSQHWSEDIKKRLPFNDILEGTIDIDSSLSDSLFKDLSSNEGDTFMTNTMTVDGSTLCDSVTIDADQFEKNVLEDEENEVEERKVVRNFNHFVTILKS